jgi:hypothetical protein
MSGMNNGSQARVRRPGRAEFLRVTAQFTSAYELLEIARPGKDCLAIEKTKLVGWIKGLRKGLDRA